MELVVEENVSACRAAEEMARATSGPAAQYLNIYYKGQPFYVRLLGAQKMMAGYVDWDPGVSQ